MKKIIGLVALGILVFISSCSTNTENPKPVIPQPDSSVSNIKNAYIANFTATWCGYCGSKAKPAIKVIQDNFKEKVQVINFHASRTGDRLYNFMADSLSEMVPVEFFPTVLVNYKTQIDFDSTDGQDLVTKQLSQIAKAGLRVFSKKTSASEYEIKVKYKFFEGLTGKYSIAVYLTEDNIADRQNGATYIGRFIHNDVFRDFVGKDFDMLLGKRINPNSEPILKDNEGNFTLKYEFPTNVKEQDAYFTGIIYQLDEQGKKPIEVLNTFKIKAL